MNHSFNGWQGSLAFQDQPLDLGSVRNVALRNDKIHLFFFQLFDQVLYSRLARPTARRENDMPGTLLS